MATETQAGAATGLTTDHTRAQSTGGHGHGPQSLTPRAGASRADRLTSYRLADFPVPTGREEEWRFTPVRQLTALFDGGLADDALQVRVEAAPGVTVETVPAGDPRLGLTPPPGDRIAAAAWESVRHATVITVTADGGTTGGAAGGTTANGGAAGNTSHDAEPAYDVTPGAPAAARASSAVDFGPGVTTVTLTGADETPSAGLIVVIVEPNARGTVVLRHQGRAQHAQNVELVLGEGSHLELISTQDWDLGAVHASSHRARVGKDATLKHVVITLGGGLVRLTPEATYAGPGGEVEMLGLYLTDSGQHHEHRLYVDHDLPRCRSRVTYKGALQGASAHSVWIGDVLIRAAAEGTDTYEQNRNLVLTDGARADSVPNLEIETGEIEGAGHASATGRFDDEQLFYLMARGIPERTARRLVVHGFFADLIQRIGVPALEAELMAAIDAELARALEAGATAAADGGAAGSPEGGPAASAAAPSQEAGQ